MPVTERRKRRRLVLREAILDAARTIVRDDGLAALTMRRIADAVDYAPASLYAHFANREALLAELCHEGMTALLLDLEGALQPARDPRARLVALGMAYVRFALERPETYRLIFMEDPALTKGTFETIERNDGERALALITTQLADLRAAGKLRRSANLAALTDLFWTIVHGIASLRLACGSMPQTDDATLVNAAVTAIVEGSRPTTR